MLGVILKYSFVLNILFLFIILFCQTTIIDASPIMEKNNQLVASDRSTDKHQRGGQLVKRSLHLTVDQPILIDDSLRRSRRLRKKFHNSKLKKSRNIFQSTGLNKHQDLKSLQNIVDNRLKRFRMLDPDEFQEMLNSWSHQTPDEQAKEYNSMDTIGGMQLENYWSRK